MKCKLNLCHICVEEVGEYSIVWFAEPESLAKILAKIHECTQLNLYDAKYPNFAICTACLGDLNTAYDLRLKCIRSRDKFSQFMNKLEEITIKSEDRRSQDGTLNPEINNQDSHINLESKKNIEDSDIDADITAEAQVVKDVLNELYEGSSANNTECDLCGKTLKSKSSLKQHKFSMHLNRKHIGRVTGNGSTRRYHCTTCSYSTPHSQTLVNHMRRHNGDRPYKCICGKAFTQASALSAHQWTHSAEHHYTCSICDKQFKLAHSLKKHMRVHKEGTFSCNICHKNLKSKETLLDHLNRHVNIRNYNCEKCGETFVTSSELITHKKKHSDQKSVQCHYCGYVTKKKKVLIVHLKRHSGERKFSCNLCEASAYTASELKVHQRVHTRAKPYPCSVCTQRFAHSSSLNKHMRRVHGKIYQWDKDSKNKLASIIMKIEGKKID